MLFNKLEIAVESQSLSSRAMSFDGSKRDHKNYLEESQSLSSRAMSFDILPFFYFLNG